jgi:putative transposase
LKGKSAIAVARQYGGKNRSFSDEKRWASGYAVSTVGFELEKVQKYIAQQEKLEKDQEDGKF